MKQKLYVVSSILILTGLALIVWGLERSPFSWIAGLVLVAAAMLASFLTRWFPEEEE